MHALLQEYLIEVSLIHLSKMSAFQTEANNNFRFFVDLFFSSSSSAESVQKIAFIQI